MKLRTLALVAIPVSLASPSIVHATGYFVVTAHTEMGSQAIGFSGEPAVGLAGQPINGPGQSFGSFLMGGDTDAYAALYDFNGDGVPEVVTASNTSDTVEIQSWDGTVLQTFQIPGTFQSPGGGPITISGSTITVQTNINTVNSNSSVNFTYDPPGDPVPNNSFLDLNGDGIADQVVPSAGALGVLITDGATNTTYPLQVGFRAFPTNIQVLTYSPSIAPEPASLALLSLAALPLLRSRKRIAR